jgi:hypothetical protein
MKRKKVTYRDKAIKILSRKIPIEPNEYTENEIQKLIKKLKQSNQ